MELYELPRYITIILFVYLPIGLYSLFTHTKFLYTRLDNYDRYQFFKKVCLGSLLISFFTLTLVVSSYMFLWEIEKLQEVSIFVFVFGFGFGFVISFFPPFFLRFIYTKFNETNLIDQDWSVWGN